MKNKKMRGAFWCVLVACVIVSFVMAWLSFDDSISVKTAVLWIFGADIVGAFAGIMLYFTKEV